MADIFQQVMTMSDQLLYFNGIDGDTGTYECRLLALRISCVSSAGK